MVNFSYGNSKAAIKLEQILEEMGSTDPKTKSYKIKVGSIINDCNIVLNELRNIKNKRVFEMVWQCWHIEMSRRITNCMFPKPIHTHLKCVIRTMLKGKRREYLINNGTEKERQKLNLIKNKRNFEAIRKHKGGI
jgi:hypothetical protein